MGIKKNQNKTTPTRMLCKGEALGLLLSSRNMSCLRLAVRAFQKMLLMACQEMMELIDKALFLSN